MLKSELQRAAIYEDALPAETDEYGQRYVIDLPVHGPSGSARVRSLWIARRDESSPRFVTCYVL